MKQTIFTFLFFTVIALVSCRKNGYDPTITQYDDDQIQAYIKANGITGMVRDTSGIYYKIINPGVGKALDYTDTITMVYSLKSLDGKFISDDTLVNHFVNYVGHVYSSNFTYGLQLAIHNLANHRGVVARILVPSHLGYGVGGSGTGSSTITNGRIGGNECLDYSIHLISDQDAYDQSMIKQYIAAQGLTSSMHQDPSGFWYAITTPGTGTVPITDNTTVTATFTLALLNGTVIDQFTDGSGEAIDIPDIIKGMQIGLKKYATAGSLMSFILPSSLSYGSKTVGPAPAYSVVRYDIQVIDVSP